MRGFSASIFSLLLCAGVESALAQNKPVVISGAGNVAPLIEKYRKLIGEPNNGDGPAQPGGRREINWDGVPDDKAAPAFLAPDAFKARGARLNTPGKGVQVSAKPGNPSNTPPGFGHINPTYTK